MVNVQDVFNKVIGEFYAEDKEVLMCKALDNARKIGKLDAVEYCVAKQDIKDYLKAFGSLGGMLMHASKPYDFNFRLEIYKDWNNRPEIKVAKK